ncbi:MAG TPA: hypothetical protein DEA08_17285 [Planctomycetes bacterium]|nr:hypothetical protein [Planctomycetota bacterium]
MSWKTVALAILRGGVRGMTTRLGPASAQPALAAIKEHEELVLGQAIPSLQSYTGFFSPPKRLGVGQLEQLASAAFEEARATDQEELSETLQRMIDGTADDERELERFARRLPQCLLRHAPLRKALTEGEDPSRVHGGSGLSLKALVGLGAMAFVGSVLGFVASRPKLDLSPPQIEAKAEGGHHVRAATVKISGQVQEQRLVSLSVNGKLVQTKELNHDLHAFEVTVPLPQLGHHEITLQATDEKGRRSEQVIAVERLPYPVEIELLEPAHAVRGGEEPTRIAGRVRAEATVTALTVNGVELQLTNEGSFTGAVDLPGKTGEFPLRFVAKGPEAAGELVAKVTVDHDPPRLKVTPHDPTTWGELYELPFRLEDRSDWCEVRVLSGGEAKPRRFHPLRSEHLSVKVGPGQSTLRLQAVDAAGNESEVVEVRVTRKEPSAHLAPFQVTSKHFRVTRSLKIPAGDALVLPPGSKIELAPKVGVVVEGQLIAPGSRSQPIEVCGQDLSSSARMCEGLTVRGPKASAKLSFLTIRGGHKDLGGGLYVTAGAQLRANDCTFAGNHAGKNGGGLYVNGLRNQPAQVLLERVRFVQNHAGSEGGGANFNGYVQARLSECGFEKNDAGSFGGGLVTIGFEVARTRVELSKCAFNLNKARWGGALQVGKSAELVAKDLHLESNTASREGGALYTRGLSPTEQAHLELEDGRVNHNRASSSGGGLYLGSFSAVELRGTTIEGNSTPRYGGGAFVRGHSKGRTQATFERVHFVANRAKDGGGLNVNYFGQAVVKQSLFASNQASGWGGGACVVGNAALPTRFDLISCKFKLNKSPRYHGPDVRIANNVEFDPKQLVTSGVRGGQASVAAHVHAARPTEDHDLHPSVKTPNRKAVSHNEAARRQEAKRSAGKVPDAPDTGGLMREVEDDWGRALAHYVAAAARKDYRALRARPSGGSKTLRSYQAKVQFPGAEAARIWDSGDKHYASVTVLNAAPAEQAGKAFAALLAKLRGHLGDSWQEHALPVRGKTKVHEFKHVNPAIQIRVSQTHFELRGTPCSSVIVFFN